MPNREQRRSGELDKVGFRVTIGDDPYEIEIGNLSAQDEFDFGQACNGMTFFEAFEHMSSYVVAAFVWLERRKYEKRLTFTEVADEVHVRDLESLQVFGEDDDGGAGTEAEPSFNPSNPELSGGPSATTSLGSPQSTD